MPWWKWCLALLALGLVVVGGVLGYQQFFAPEAERPPAPLIVQDPPPPERKPLPARLSPGLIAEYRSLRPDDDQAALTRIDPKPAYSWGTSSPHPRLPGEFRVVWTGAITLRQRGPVKFRSRIGGLVRVEVDDESVLLAKGETEDSLVEGTQKLDRPAGTYRLRIDYRTVPGVPARVQLEWQGPGFGPEPIPAEMFQYAEEELPIGARLDAERERGREAVVRLGCGQCHARAFPGVEAPLPGPSLADAGQRLSSAWLNHWLADPAKLRPNARMPALFADDRRGAAERHILAEYLAPGGFNGRTNPMDDAASGREAFQQLGCIACHVPPDSPEAVSSRSPLHNLGTRFDPLTLAAFLKDPDTRYADGRMPRLPLQGEQGQNVAAWLLKTSKPVAVTARLPDARHDAITEVLGNLGVKDRAVAARRLLRTKGCLNCHAGLEGEPLEPRPIARPTREDVAFRGCLGGKTLPRFELDFATRQAIAMYLSIAGKEMQESPFARRQELLTNAGCVRCHARDQERTSPLEEALKKRGAPIAAIPPLDYATRKYPHDRLLKVLRDGGAAVPGSCPMPAFGERAEELIQALAEGDGELPRAK